MPLVFVPTPLGNLRDITLRALDHLREAALIVAEDTRVARKLLAALQITGRELWSYREENARDVTPQILERARNEDVVVTCDAGMPGVSDPGSALVAAARDAGIAVAVLPGPSVPPAVALLSGFPLDRFSFEGFPPRTTGARKKRFDDALRREQTTIWYESPHRLQATLKDLAVVAPDARVFVVREYTKLHEEQLWGTPDEIVARVPERIRGEVAFAVAPYAAAPKAHVGSTDDAIDSLLRGGGRVGDVAKVLAKQGFGDRRRLYARVAARKALRDASLNEG
ncbi:MAG: 16S rRNA (cytidine(1402)-2'-O)-methyltransferase [Candidatus Eremiobacteraeota bacterium]|nr:16S rRNA (cytidine(1402)-2'-O)-methyltransferase [Candidatus Eremiobacteraeota bacterium]MBV9055314.1 16S rRNA (cytidine(1402)-2'-O)-methyltransferase [Candidatus Eremiobacteraeota bacterium]MBV9700994.1 16S rRNA (cytidine(1402)-2'-O)-methyltransferase [Candidatus Eremiobacteraeota bacterium]